MAPIDEALQTIRPAIVLGNCVQIDAVVSPSTVARECRHRHQLDMRDPQLDQIIQPLDRARQRASRRKRADVQLVLN